jgi:hypothetical protein
LYWRKPRGTTVWKGVRQGSLKYVARTQDDACEEHLFDLASDVAEKEDLKDLRKEDFGHLRRLYDLWEEEVRRNRRGRP